MSADLIQTPRKHPRGIENLLLKCAFDKLNTPPSEALYQHAPADAARRPNYGQLT